MIEIPTYLKLVVNQGARRAAQTTRPANPNDEASRRDRACGGETLDHARGQEPSVIISLADTRRRDQCGDEPPLSAEEAGYVLGQLERDLPELGQGVHELHDNLDRSRVLVLLAPLVDD